MTGQDRGGPGRGAGARRGLPGRHRGAAGAAGAGWVGGVRSGGVPAGQLPCGGRAAGAGGDPGRAGGGAGAGLGAGWGCGAGRGRRPDHDRPGCHYRDRAFRERRSGADLEEDVRFSSHDRLRRPRRRRDRGAAGHRVAGRGRRIEHGRRPYRGLPAGAGPVAAPPAAQGTYPGRLRRRHARVPGVADRQVPPPALLGRHDHHRGHAGRGPPGPGRFLDAGL